MPADLQGLGDAGLSHRVQELERNMDELRKETKALDLERVQEDVDEANKHMEEAMGAVLP